MSPAAAGLEVAVIGAGVFGVVTALRLAAAGHGVTLFDRAAELLRGASGHANRVHQGYHYPRHEPTARQCLAGQRPFAAAFAAALLPGVTNDYFIAEAGSLTGPAAFLAFCDRLGLPYRLVDPEAASPRMQQVSLGLRTDEGLFDAAILRRLLLERLGRSGVALRLGSEVGQLARRGTGFALTAGGETLAADAVVNCGYAEINRLTARLGHPIPPRQYEYTVAPVIAPPWPGPASVTVMDGPFFSLLPMDRDGRHLLFHVDHSVVARSDAPLLDPAWLAPATAPFQAARGEALFQRVLGSASAFLPALRDARLLGFLQGVRMVLANHEDSDARPSFVTRHEPGYLTVFAGKIDHCLEVADQVVTLLARP